MQFSKSTGCFYPKDIPYAAPPDDLIDVTREEYEKAMDRPQRTALDVVEGRLVIVPVQAPTAAQLRVELCTTIKAERDRRIQSGGYKVAGRWFHSDQWSRNQQLGLALLGANVPANLQWKTMDGTFIVITPELAGQILAGAARSDMVIFATAEAKLLALATASDPSTIDALSGWPKIYGE
jgi:hypothetical protein